jgi:hypothetical protein
VICPRCGDAARCIDTRMSGPNLKRRRECKCGRFTAYEIREDAFNREIVVTTRLKIGLEDGRISAQDAIDLKFLCACGNEARYAKDKLAAPTLCGLCDLEKNDGKGRRV